MFKKEKETKELTELCDFITSTRPPEAHLVKNGKRYDEAMDAIQAICKFAIDSNPKGTTISTNQDVLTGPALEVEIISNLTVFKDMEKFCAALSKADTFEVCSLTDGRYSMGISFEDAYDLAPPENSPFPTYEKHYGEKVTVKKFK
jgi:hypothetical protein